MHTHFFPEKLFESIWEYFTSRNWKIRYQDTTDGLVRILESLGVARFTTYNYAHRTGIAAELNNWTVLFCRKHPEAIPFATVHPGDGGNTEMLETLFKDHSFAGIKIQPLVTDFYPFDERMTDVYRTLFDSGRILTIHAGTAPVANRYVGADNFEPVMKRFPEMKVIVAHMGAYEFDRFFDMARTYPNLYLDTSVNFIDRDVISDLIRKKEFPPLELPSPVDLDPGALDELSDKLLFGSDFPNIPYAYEESIRGIIGLDMGEEFNRAVFFENARRLLATVPT